MREQTVVYVRYPRGPLTIDGEKGWTRKAFDRPGDAHRDARNHKGQEVRVLRELVE